MVKSSDVILFRDWLDVDLGENHKYSTIVNYNDEFCYITLHNRYIRNKITIHISSRAKYYYNLFEFDDRGIYSYDSVDEAKKVVEEYLSSNGHGVLRNGLEVFV